MNSYLVNASKLTWLFLQRENAVCPASPETPLQKLCCHVQIVLGGGGWCVE